jgi:hypothetical protein
MVAQDKKGVPMSGNGVPMRAYERPEVKELGKVSIETLGGSGSAKGYKAMKVGKG